MRNGSTAQKKKTRTTYLAPDEQDPHRTVQNKNYITKVMFLSAQTRPRYDQEGNFYFDGKLGSWPFVREVLTIMFTFFLILSIQLEILTVLLCLCRSLRLMRLSCWWLRSPKDKRGPWGCLRAQARKCIDWVYVTQSVLNLRFSFSKYFIFLYI